MERRSILFFSFDQEIKSLNSFSKEETANNQYSAITETLFNWVEENFAIKILREEDIKRALFEPPKNSRAFLRKEIVNRFGENLSEKTFAIWGLAFKPGTDDMREAPAIYIIKDLVNRGAKIKAYDPKAMKEAKEYYLKGITGITYCNSKYETLQNVDAMLLLTEWKEFRSPDFEELKSQMKNAIIFDGRNQYSNLSLEKKGFEYFQIGKIT